ncbi:MAG: glutamate racemase [Sphingorhabdus sp.]|nr:glutamate racemase [Sphingorhabdus sp.]
MIAEIQPLAPGAPLLFFDSGIGGLSVLRAVKSALPHAPIVYAADYAGMPYGARSEDEIASRVPALLGRLAERYQPRLAVIACNTACTIALAHVRAALNIPVVGTVPAIKPASLATKSGVIGLLGTAATIRQHYVDRLQADFAADMILLRHGAPDLVLAAEAMMRGENVDPAIYSAAIDGLRGQPGGDKMDVVVLGCTHFPLVECELSAADPALTFVDGAAGIARRIAALTKAQQWPEAQAPSIFVTTGDITAMEPYQTGLQKFGDFRIEKL